MPKKPKAKKPRPFTTVHRSIIDKKDWSVVLNADGDHEWIDGTYQYRSDAVDMAGWINAAAEAWLAERCAACPAKQAQDAMVRFKELLGNRPAPVPPSAKNLEAAQKRILSTLNAAERRIVEARYGIPSNVDTSAGVPVTDGMEIKGTLVHPAYGGMMEASDVYCPKGHAWKLLSPKSCQLECGVICEKGWKRMGGGIVENKKPKHGAKSKARKHRR